ncbi:tripartite tricarboxylate transporter substrate binding protein [Pigmentiphaga soli]|uniref:Tripartite tricarboxylate transporter substrate binding protein n=1 Tax=Pigmentiphaga soli TaxID=1007095 RepID=A0ABP8GKM5_9BURK
MNLKPRIAAALLAVAGMIAAGPAAAAAESAADYPSKPIRFICTSAAGSPLDLMMRTTAKFLGDELKQTIVVENRTGGTGAVGMATAMNSPADGYVIVSATGSTSFLMADPKSSYSPDDFLFFRGLQAEPSAVAVRADSPYRTLGDLVKALRETPDKVSVGGYAAAGFHQFVFYRLQQVGNFKAIWVPFQGGNQAALALMGKQIDAAVLTPSSALGQVQNGDMRLLGISTEKRDPTFPGVPTFKEQGLDVVELLWRGLMVKKGTPPEIVAKLSAALDRVEAKPEWKAFMKANAQSPVNLTADQMQRHVVEEVASRRKFLQTIGVVK